MLCTAARRVGRALTIAVLLALGACSSRPPAAPGRDAGRRAQDGAVTPSGEDGGEPTLPGRPDGGPRLPPTDRSIVLPYRGASVEQELEVEGEVGTLDVFFSIDTTGSFGGEIDNLQAELRTRILPELRSRVTDVAFGVGRFEDFPAAPWGGPGDRPFALGAAITTDDSRVSSAVAALDQPLGSGGDVAESGAEALYQIATGEGYSGHIPRYSGRPAPGGGSLGGVGFRSDALRVVVHVTDAPTHEPADYGAAFPGTRSLTQAIDALDALGVRALGIASGRAARSHLEALALGTGATIDPVGGLCRTGVDGESRPPAGGRCPLVFDVRSDGTGLSETIVDAITDLLSTVRYDEVWAESDDRLGFVRAFEALSATPPEGVSPPTAADRRPAGDGVDDTFLAVGHGTLLRFRAILRNETIPPADYDQYFNLTLRVVGDGVTLASRRIRVTVPRGRQDGGEAPVDGGAGAGADAGAEPLDAGPDGG
jgi:hypothetical protein